MKKSGAGHGWGISETLGLTAMKTRLRQTTAVPGGGLTTPIWSLSELDSLIEAVAKNLPASQVNPKNQKHIASLEKVMRRYFRRLETALPTKRIAALYNRYVEE